MGAQGYIGRAPGDSSVIVARQTFTPTGITTNFTFASGYTVGYVDAYLNGARLIEGEDYTATDGSVVGLTTHAQNGDVLELVVYKAFNVANVTAATDDFSVGGDLSVTGNTELTGTLTVGGVEVQPGAAGTWASYDSNTGISTTKKVKIENNLEVTGVGTITGDLTVGGVLTYDDVTNVDSIGIITARSHVSIADSILHTGDTDTSIRFPAADTFTVETAGSERLRITSSGKVGIGTENPTEKLHIFDRTGSGGLIHYDGASNTHFGLRIRSNSDGGNFESDFANGTTAMLDLFADASTVSGGDFLVCRSQDANPILLVKGNGRIGVGTAAPQGVFQIESTTTTDMIMLNADGLNFAKLGHNSASGTDILDVRSEGHTRFLTNGNNERVRITSAGLVGIATVLPEAQLTVKGDGDIAAKDFKYTYTNTHGLQVKGNESAIDIVGTDGGNHGSSLLLRTSIDGFGMHFDPTRDQLRFKYTVPSADDFNIHDGTNTSTNTEVLTIGKTGICTATQFDATSDITLKENIEVINEPIVKLSQLKGVTFDWKAGGHSVGVIAQDVEKVLPTAVGGSEDRKTVNYNAIIGLLVESVKDQQKQIEELKSLLDK